MEVTAIPRSVDHDIEEPHEATRGRRGERRRAAPTPAEEESDPDPDPDPGGGADRARAPGPPSGSR